MTCHCAIAMTRGHARLMHVTRVIFEPALFVSVSFSVDVRKIVCDGSEAVELAKGKWHF
jgi:hypothetical protein